MPQQYNLQNKVFFYTALAVLGALAFWLMSGYLDVIAFSLMMVIILKPVYDYFHKRLKLKPGLATTATLLSLAVAIIIPGWIMLRIVSNQLTAMSESLSPEAAEQTTALENFQMRLNEALSQAPPFHNFSISDETVDEVTSYARASVGWLGVALVNLGMAIPTILAKFFVFLAIVGVLLPNYHRFVQRLRELSPLSDEVDQLYLRKIKSMVWAMFLGIAVIAVAQGLAMGVFIWLGDVPYAPLWTMLAILFSTLPLGASLIAIPLAIYQLVVGNPVSALIIFGGYLLVVSNIDSVLRPRLVTKEAYLDAALVLVASLGGYDLFGFFGVVYGPVLMVLLMTTIEVYSQYYAVRQTPPPVSEAEVDGADSDVQSPSSDKLPEPLPSLSEVK